MKIVEFPDLSRVQRPSDVPQKTWYAYGVDQRHLFFENYPHTDGVILMSCYGNEQHPSGHSHALMMRRWRFIINNTVKNSGLNFKMWTPTLEQISDWQSQPFDSTYFYQDREWPVTEQKEHHGLCPDCAISE